MGRRAIGAETFLVVYMSEMTAVFVAEAARPIFVTFCANNASSLES